MLEKCISNEKKKKELSMVRRQGLFEALDAIFFSDKSK